MRGAVLALALALPGAALAHDPRPQVQFDPAYAWFDGPTHRSGSDGRVRLVPQPRHGTAAMTENQYYAYTLAYRRHMAHLSMRMPAPSADARARHAAWHEVVGPNGRRAPVGSFETEPLQAGAVPLNLTPFD